jgi:cystathionine beta-lyase/cystathionine gamma-synthase
MINSGFGGMLTFDVKGGATSGRRFVERLKLINLAVSLGSTESLCQHPASMTHVMVGLNHGHALYHHFRSTPWLLC